MNHCLSLHALPSSYALLVHCRMYVDVVAVDVIQSVDTAFTTFFSVEMMSFSRKFRPLATALDDLREEMRWSVSSFGL